MLVLLWKAAGSDETLILLSWDAATEEAGFQGRLWGYGAGMRHQWGSLRHGQGGRLRFCSFWFAVKVNMGVNTGHHGIKTFTTDAFHHKLELPAIRELTQGVKRWSYWLPFDEDVDLVQYGACLRVWRMCGNIKDIENADAAASFGASWFSIMVWLPGSSDFFHERGCLAVWTIWNKTPALWSIWIRRQQGEVPLPSINQNLWSKTYK
jgi:hypothetical protein